MWWWWVYIPHASPASVSARDDVVGSAKRDGVRFFLWTGIRHWFLGLKLDRKVGLEAFKHRPAHRQLHKPRGRPDACAW